MEVDKLEAGRSLDAMIAERVMGWQRWRHNDGVVHLHEPQASRWLPRYNAVPTDEPFTEWDTSMFKASTDIAAAWEVVEKMVTERRMFRLGFNGNGYHFECSLPDDKYPVFDSGTYPTAPLAICAAALLATSAPEQTQQPPRQVVP